MKCVGIIGGLSPESTIAYYQWLNEGVRQKLGGHNSARLLISSVNFADFVALKEKGDWDSQADLLVEEAKRLEKAGADFLILATNTMHKMADQIEAAIDIPFLHLADATADHILTHNINKVGLLGTRYTMAHDFYKDRLIQKNITPIVPDTADQTIINDIIYDELCQGQIKASSRQAYQAIIEKLAADGAEGVILGCTEITLLIGQADCNIPVFDTTRIHVDQTLVEMFI